MSTLKMDDLAKAEQKGSQRKEPTPKSEKDHQLPNTSSQSDSGLSKSSRPTTPIAIQEPSASSAPGNLSSHQKSHITGSRPRRSDSSFSTSSQLHRKKSQTSSLRRQLIGSEESDTEDLASILPRIFDMSSPVKNDPLAPTKTNSDASKLGSHTTSDTGKLGSFGGGDHGYGAAGTHGASLPMPGLSGKANGPVGNLLRGPVDDNGKLKNAALMVGVKLDLEAEVHLTARVRGDILVGLY
ncbi:hypothetical protein G7054_g1215 [Neopestalotiopsis clavispora]|nr:hypothetical protein G7054_g1215 [Neopestalotiopsis clavispora]